MKTMVFVILFALQASAAFAMGSWPGLPTSTLDDSEPLSQTAITSTSHDISGRTQTTAQDREEGHNLAPYTDETSDWPHL